MIAAMAAAANSSACPRIHASQLRRIVTSYIAISVRSLFGRRSTKLLYSVLTRCSGVFHRRFKRLFECPTLTESRADGLQRDTFTSSQFKETSPFAAVFAQISAKWRSQCLFLGPTFQAAALQRLVPEASVDRCASKRRTTHHDIVSLVIGLFWRNRPTNVSWRIRAVIVDTVQRMSRRRASAHEGDERNGVLSPLIAHEDSTTAVVGVGAVARVVATALCALPNSIFRRGGQVVSSVYCGSTLSLQAAATLSHAASEIRRGDNLRFSTIALAAPVRVMPRPWFGADSYEPIESLSRRERE